MLQYGKENVSSRTATSHETSSLIGGQRWLIIQQNRELSGTEPYPISIRVLKSSMKTECTDTEKALSAAKHLSG